MKNENLKPNLQIIDKKDAQNNMQLFRFEKVVTINCEHCHKEKTSKNIAILDDDWARKICNGCYGERLSKDISVTIKNIYS